MSNEGLGQVRVGGYLTADAAAGWERFCADHGVTITAIFEVCGLALARGEESFTLIERVGEARRLARERAARRRGPPDTSES